MARFFSNSFLALVVASAAALSCIAQANAQGCVAGADALGVSRTVEIDTTGGAGFGLQQYKAHDFLQQGEVVLTFDDGPWPKNTEAVLAALAAHCTKATFFIIGKHAIAHPHILKKVKAGGHTIGSHTWSHANLAKKKMLKSGLGKEEIEKGLSAVKAALGSSPAPFFRFPFLQDPDELVAYLGERNIAIFSMDLDSFDFKQRNPDRLVKSVMGKLKKKGKGILLMHDFQKVTATAIPALLKELKKAGYKIVHLRARDKAQTLPKYDEAMAEELSGPLKNARPTSSVVRTVPN